MILHCFGQFVSDFCCIDMFTYIFERVGLVADGARLAVDALPKRGREDPARELVRVAETGRVNCMRHMKISAMSRADRKSQGSQCLDFCTADFWSLLA